MKQANIVHSYMNRYMSRNARIPLVEICGRKRVLIENHYGVAGYDSHEIIVNISLGNIRITGKELKISLICKEKLIITGVVESVRFCGRECRDAV